MEVSGNVPKLHRMAKKKTLILESVKIEKEIVDKVREHKKKTYMPIGEFFKLAAQEKLNINKNKQK